MPMSKQPFAVTLDAADVFPAAPVPPVAQALRPFERARLLEAGAQIQECYRVLAKGGLNVVGEVLRGQGEFVEFEHYPTDDVFDQDSGGQYYYHAHREGEHGHFHTFLRARGIPAGIAPLAAPHASAPWPQGDDALSHLMAISMNRYGFPKALFATNRWVTDETWYAADDVIAMLDHYVIDHAFPSWPVNRWISAMLVLFRPHIEVLLRHRDAVVAWHQRVATTHDVFEDRALEATGSLDISVDDWMQELHRAQGVL